MIYGNLPGVDRPISRLIMGTMVCTTDNMALTGELLDAYVGQGGNCLDTAIVYGGGKAEHAIGEWMAERGNRKDLVVIDKGSHPIQDGAPRVNPQCIADDIAENLNRLKTDYVDIWMLHRDDPEYPVQPIMDCLNEQLIKGSVRAFGASNWTNDRISAANAYAAANGLRGFIASSNYLGLGLANEPTWEGCVMLGAADRAWHKKTQFPLLPWSSQASGFFTGRYKPTDTDAGDVERVFFNSTNWKRLASAEKLARKLECTSGQIALSWVLCQPFPVFPLIGPRTISEIHDTMGALDIVLSPHEMNWLERGTTISLAETGEQR